MNKSQLRKEIAAARERFIKEGGSITVLPLGKVNKELTKVGSVWQAGRKSVTLNG